jgi:hypothetical protein
MLQRNTIINQLVAISGAAFAAVGTLLSTNHFVVGCILFLIATPILLLTFRMNESDILVTAERLEEIRVQINALAGESLLKSETATGRSTMGYIPNFRYGVRPFNKVANLFNRLWRRLTASN